MKDIIKETLSTNAKVITKINKENMDSNIICIVDATDGLDFQEYSYLNGVKVADGTQVGYEIYLQKINDWELVLFKDIMFRIG